MTLMIRKNSTKYYFNVLQPIILTNLELKQVGFKIYTNERKVNFSLKWLKDYHILI